MSTDDIFQSQPLVLPAKVNTSEIERIRDILTEHVAELDDVIALAETKPKSALRLYMATIATLRKVFTAAEIQGSQAWVMVGMKKTELSRIIDQPRATIDRKLKASRPSNFEEEVSAAQRRHQQIVSSERDEGQTAQPDEAPGQTKKTSPNGEVNPYDDADYEVM